MRAEVYANESNTIVVNPSRVFNVWEGWGTSLAWWSKVFVNRIDLADVFFSYDIVKINDKELPGLGLNIVRYNLGACSWNSYHGKCMEVSENIISSRQMEGFWLDWASDNIASSSWDMNVDQNQRQMLLLSKERNGNIFELFVNSPMWWMLRNLNPSGADIGSNDNLQQWNYDSFAHYMTSIAQYSAENWGVKFDYIEPFNEPESDWWTASNNQEGCHFATSTQEILLQKLHNEMSQKGLLAAGTAITASDENSYTLALSSWNGLNSTVQGLVKKINVHGYEYGTGRRDLLFDAAQEQSKVLWNSEYGEGDASGLSLVSNLNLDFKWLHMTAWVYWQVLDGGGWGLIDADMENAVINDVNTKFFVLAHYTRHILPGMLIIEAQDDNTIAAYDDQAEKLTIVAMNYETDRQEFCFDLSNFVLARDEPILTWITNVKNSEGDRYIKYENRAQISSESILCTTFDAETIETIEIRAHAVSQQ